MPEEPPVTIHTSQASGLRPRVRGRTLRALQARLQRRQLRAPALALPASVGGTCCVVNKWQGPAGVRPVSGVWERSARLMHPSSKA